MGFFDSNYNIVGSTFSIPYTSQKLFADFIYWKPNQQFWFNFLSSSKLMSNVEFLLVYWFLYDIP